MKHKGSLCRAAGLPCLWPPVPLLPAGRSPSWFHERGLPFRAPESQAADDSVFGREGGFQPFSVPFVQPEWGRIRPGKHLAEGHPDPFFLALFHQQRPGGVGGVVGFKARPCHVIHPLLGSPVISAMDCCPCSDFYILGSAVGLLKHRAWHVMFAGQFCFTQPGTRSDSELGFGVEQLFDLRQVNC